MLLVQKSAIEPGFGGNYPFLRAKTPIWHPRSYSWLVKQLLLFLFAVSPFKKSRPWPSPNWRTISAYGSTIDAWHLAALEKSNPQQISSGIDRQGWPGKAFRQESQGIKYLITFRKYKKISTGRLIFSNWKQANPVFRSQQPSNSASTNRIDAICSIGIRPCKRMRKGGWTSF